MCHSSQLNYKFDEMKFTSGRLSTNHGESTWLRILWTAFVNIGYRHLLDQQKHMLSEMQE